ncbi:LysR substrate-binding domain-containing protein [Aestuariispira insulae]|uniref:LysR family glycine cleavage system transcriptional activator n=1 Tax=Aestuariispira insulae TaxID=1461337 RepID=A0A3D9H8F9_9PROT|nr:LysR substrate-binding domain-containing protein [Aestuariispira insulae]RED45768.1 LysR family glycine cleavage system transcriptional activator [Aestuariispira insulae]
MKDLPPLKAIRAFEACYRLRSFTQAAGSLNVGQPAISHQIRLLERDLGVKLFEKKGARILPTRLAHDYYDAIRTGLGEIARASQVMRRHSQTRAITLASYPGIGAFWALPRIETYRRIKKSLDVRLVSADLDADIDLNECDCAILFGRSDQWPGFVTSKLLDEEVIAVAAPAQAEMWAGKSVESLLSEAPLIALEDPENRWLTWEDWREKHAPSQPAIQPAMTVTNHGIALNLALMGHGITLAWKGVVTDFLETGTLASLPFAPLTSDRGYHFITSETFRDRAVCADLLEALTTPPGR